MSLFVTLAADALVALLLAVTIATSLRLSRRIAGLKADESAMRRTIGDLVTASAAAERAIAGLRAALDECDRGLSERIDGAERTALDLAAHVEAGEGVIARIGAIVAQAAASPARPAARRETEAPAPVEQLRPAAKPGAMPGAKPVAAPAVRAVSNGERIDVALAAAQAMSERALDRLRARAA